MALVYLRGVVSGAEADMSGGGARNFRARGRRDPGFEEGVLYIEVEGARKLQMRCSFRPCNRDQTL